MPLLSKTPVAAHSGMTMTNGAAGTPSSAPPIPSIRLISATPSASGLSSSEASTSFHRALEDSWATMPSLPSMPSPSPSPLAPKAEPEAQARRKLVPKKSKLSILSMGMGMSLGKKDSDRDHAHARARDFSDVVRRVGVSDREVQQGFGTGTSSARGGFEIYVDPTEDPDIGEIVMVKKKKSRAGLDGMRWGGGGAGPGAGNGNGAMGEVTNVPKAVKLAAEGGKEEKEKKDGLLKVKAEDGYGSGKWWSIGRGRKDSKEKEKKENKISHKPVEFIYDPNSRSKTPEPLKPTPENRGRFNSLDSGVLLNNAGPKPKPALSAPTNTNAGSVRGLQAYQAYQTQPQAHLQAQPQVQPQPQVRPQPHAHAQATVIPMPADEEEEDRPPSSLGGGYTRSRTGTLTSGGLLAVAPPGAGAGIGAAGQGQGQGSIALRAIRSVRSLARMGSWAQLKSDGDLNASEVPAPVPKERKEKEKTGKKKSVKSSGGAEDEKPKKEKAGKKEKTKTKDEKEKDSKKEKTKSKSKTKDKTKDKEPKAKDTLRLSSSSFEAGALTASPGPAPGSTATAIVNGNAGAQTQTLGVHTLGPKKRSTLLGLGLPSTMRLPSVRSGSSASSKFEFFGGGSASVAAPALAPVSAPTQAQAQAAATATVSYVSGVHPGVNTRVLSNVGSINANANNNNRLSVESARSQPQQGRPTSALSTNSSLRPLSTTSTTSRLSSASGSSSGVSVRWDEEGLETVREARRREREGREGGGGGDRDRGDEKDREMGEQKKERRTSRESRRSSEGRRRTPLSAVFPDVLGDGVVEGPGMGQEEEQEQEEGEGDVDERRQQKFAYPILTIEEATSDGHGRMGDDDDDDEEEEEGMIGSDDGSAEFACVDEDEEQDTRKGLATREGEDEKPAATPVKKARARPLSEQLLGRSRPRPMYEDEEGVLSILDAATNDLALLINNLDLQATPSTPDMTPLRLAGSLSPSPTPASTLEKVKAYAHAHAHGQGNASSGDGVQYNGSPKKRVGQDSPLGMKSAKKLAATMGQSLLARQGSAASISSLRPYAQSRGYPAKSGFTTNGTTPPGTTTTHMHTHTHTAAAAVAPNNNNNNAANAALISKQIAPWSTLMKGLSPVKERNAPMPGAAAATIRAKISPTPPSASASASAGTFRPGHKRTMTPAPEPEPEPVLQPLRPARSRVGMAVRARLLQVPTSPLPVGREAEVHGEEHPRAPSSLTFGPGSRSSSRGTERGRGSTEECSGSLTPVFKRIHESELDKRASLAPSSIGRRSTSSKGSRSSSSSNSNYGSQLLRLSAGSDRYDQYLSDADEEYSVPIARETRRVLGMSGTMGGSDVSCYQEPLDASDPDSDVPDELRVILSAGEERGRVGGVGSGDEEGRGMEVDIHDVDESEVEIGDSTSMEVELARSHLLPPFELNLSLPVFRAALIDEQDNHLEIDDISNSPMSEEGDTKKSFDFTGELKKLNESGGSDRRSFVEQLENAFRTPAKVDLRYDFGVLVDVPPVPELPVDFRMAMDAESTGSEGSSAGFDGYGQEEEQLVDVKMSGLSLMEKTRSGLESQSQSQSQQESKSLHFDMFSSASRIVDVKEPTILHGSDSLGSNNSTDDGHDILFQERPSPGLKPSLAASTSSRTSDGELNTSFRFGGLPRAASSKSLPEEEKELTLSDIIPPPSHVRSISGSANNSFMLDGLEDDSVLKSIYRKMVGGVPAEKPRGNLDSSTHQSAQEKRRSIYKAASRPSSGISFEGFNSFEEVRRGFEFSDERPAFYPPPAVVASVAAGRRAPHRRHESVFSIASVSSYGHVINSGSNDPFDYGLPSLRERPSSEDMTSISMSMSVDDTFAYLANKPRRRVESDASSFYFRPQQNGARGHRRRESNMSVSSQAPPISLYNRSFGHRRNDSTASSSSVAMSYIKHGANGGISAWARHRRDQSVDSVMSDFSGMHLGRPGIGDKMFETQAPLTSISASPPGSASASQENFGYDSIIDEYQRSSMEDSLFEKTGRPSSVSSDSVFGDDFSHSFQGGLLPPNQFRPLSVLSRNSVHSPMREDDTMISMLGGGHVRRRSVGSIIEASPCVRVEKRKHSAVNHKGQDQYESPNKARIVEKPSIASTSSFQFGGERMIKAQHGLLERQSLEESCLIADGEDLTSAYVPVFSRPGPATRSRSSTCTSSSGGDTPPLSASDGSSFSEGSQSSIDLSQINIALSNATHPMSTVARNRARARAPGTGHRRRYSKSHISRSSVYETIEEEMSNSNHTSPAHSLLSKKSSPTTRQAVFVVDSETASFISKPEESTWDDERGIVALRKYYALRDEAHETVTESRRQWRDTPFSLFAVQSFQAPGSPSDMQALLQHSVQNYGPLPSELRPHRIRSRTSSRPSPYPQRVSKATLSPEQTRTSVIDHQKTPVLRPVTVKKNIMVAPPSLEAFKPFSPLVMDIEPKRENAFGLAPNVRPRVGSTARRTALGWSKRSTGKSSTEQKENAVGAGTIMTPGDTLRLNRPRPRGRPTPGGRTPASQNRPIRV